MPRRSKRNNRRRRSRRSASGPSISNGVDRTTTISGRMLITIPGTAGQNFSLLQLTPLNFGPRMVALAQTFQMFRFTKINISLLPVPGVDTGLAYSKRFLDSPDVAGLSDPSEMYQLDASRYVQANMTVPYPLHLMPRDLRNTVRPWFLCHDNDTTDPFDLNQGTFVSYSETEGDSVRFELAYTIQFRGATSPDITSLQFLHI
jgi:hypothetical protein